MMFSSYAVRKLLKDSDLMLQEIQGAYALLPDTRCRRRTNCCAMLPEVTLVEALAAINQLTNKAPAIRAQLLQNIILYFFLNPVEITSCPFLKDQDCLIYEDRFFGCRAYGLWSQEHYETLALWDRQAKMHLQKQWENMGISLPRDVIEFQMPYCPFVETDPLSDINDAILLDVSDSIESISEGYLQWHHLFAQRYFSDLSFLLASLAFGFTDVVRMKLEVVSDMVNTGKREKLNQVFNTLPDLCAELI
jgi:Fe-S-cluster containining protein